MAETKTFDRVMRLIEITIVVIGGVIALVQYTNYQKYSDKIHLIQDSLKLRQDSIGLAHSNLLYEQSIATKYTDIALKKLDSSIRTSELSLQNATYKYNIDQAKLNVNQTDLETRIKAIELGILKQNSIDFSLQDSFIFKGKVKPFFKQDTLSLFTLVQNIEIKNTSKNQVQIDSIQFDYFKGERRISEDDPMKKEILMLNSPEIFGLIDWVRLERYKFYSTDYNAKNYLQINDNKAFQLSLIGPPAFGHMNSGELRSASLPTELMLKKNGWIYRRITVFMTVENKVVSFEFVRNNKVEDLLKK